MPRRIPGLGQWVTANIADLIRSAYLDGVDNAGKAMTRPNGIFDRFQKGSRERNKFLPANQRLAQGMQAATIQRYEQMVAGRKNVTSYRGGAGRFPHKLLEALKSPSMISASPSGIGFIDDGLLDRTAAHWYRLNFGAGAGGSVRPLSTSVRFGKSGHIADIGFDDQPSRAFRVPDKPEGTKVSGYFNSSNQFWLGKGAESTRQKIKSGEYTYIPRPVQTKGIEGRRFLDAGLAHFARYFHREYVRVIDELSRDAVAPNRRKRLRG